MAGSLRTIWKSSSDHFTAPVAASHSQLPIWDRPSVRSSMVCFLARDSTACLCSMISWRNRSSLAFRDSWVARSRRWVADSQAKAPMNPKKARPWMIPAQTWKKGWL